MVSGPVPVRPARRRRSAYARLVLRIIDARTGEPVAPYAARRAPTRVEAHVPGADLTGLRVLLAADVLVRALELGGTPVWCVLSGADRAQELRAAAASLGIRPFEDRRGADAGPVERQVVHVAAEGHGTPDGVRLAVAAVEPPGIVPGPDPAALRLALLSGSRTVPLRLDGTAVAEAGDTLARWRSAVAAWARQPSRPVPEDVRARLADAWEDDLDVPAVLDVLREVESRADLPDGARFETYAYADRLLGLELVRDVGASG